MAPELVLDAHLVSCSILFFALHFVRACQVAKSGKSWNLGLSSTKLTYYDGMIQLSYRNGTPYNNEKHTPRATLITFLCDRDAGVGFPEYQEEDNSTYNFRWYTSYACPEEPLECMVTDPSMMEQYDLSSLVKSEGGSGGNWYAMENSREHVTRRKYYLNVCRPLNPARKTYLKLIRRYHAMHLMTSYRSMI